jgi:hypothetical protein
VQEEARFKKKAQINSGRSSPRRFKHVYISPGGTFHKHGKKLDGGYKRKPGRRRSSPRRSSPRRSSPRRSSPRRSKHVYISPGGTFHKHGKKLDGGYKRKPGRRRSSS